MIKHYPVCEVTITTSYTTHTALQRVGPGFETPEQADEYGKEIDCTTEQRHDSEIFRKYLGYTDSVNVHYEEEE